jgi:tetratricopeptide (TPR) repeat protein
MVDRRTLAAAATGKSGAPRQVSAEPKTDPAVPSLKVVQDGVGGARTPPTGATWGAAGGPVVVGAIPQQPPGFLPRPTLLKQLNRVDWAGSVVQVVTGTPGVGKTQLAAAYARAKLAAGWRLVAWVNAEDTGCLLAGLAAVADAAGLSDGGPRQDAAEAGQAVRRQLEDDGERCLLVFDNVEAPDVVRPFLPTAGAARVLITTAQQSVADLGTTVPVDVFSDQEALAFLDGRTGLGETGAAEVAAELGHLPLALTQAAAVMNGQHLAYGPYRERLRTMSVSDHLTSEQDQPYPEGVAEAVLLSLDAIQTSDQTGVSARVMAIMAVLSAAGARRDLLHAAGRAGALAGGGARVVPSAVDGALEQLVGRSLLTFNLDGQIVIPHRLIMRVVREALARRGRLTVAYRAAASVLLQRADTLVRSRDRQGVRDISQQVTALLDHIARTTTEADAELSAVLLRLRFFSLYCLIELGDSAPRAIAVGESLTADLGRVLGPGHPDTLTAQNNLAAAYRDAGRFGEAIPLFEQTLAGRERALGAGHPDTLTSQHNLAAAYRDAGRFGEAIPLFQRTLTARERLLGPAHPSTMNSVGNLANAYRDAGRFTEAIPLFQRTLTARERLLGPDHPSTLRSRAKLASAYRRTGQVTKAIPLAKQTLASRERTLGPDDPKTLGARNNLAEAYREAGRLAEAIPLFEQTLAACERTLGPDDPRTVAARNNLTLAYNEAGRAEEAVGSSRSVDQVGGDFQDDGP